MYRARHNFAGRDGFVRKGQELNLPAPYALTLIRRGLIEPIGPISVPGPEEIKPDGPQDNKVLSEGVNIKYTCDDCGKSFDTRQGLTNHRRTHKR